MALDLSELHEAYMSVSKEDAIAMANLGAICWTSCKTSLHNQWTSSMSGEESSKADLWRLEGRKAMLDSMKSTMVNAEETAIRLARAEGTIVQLRASVEDEVTKRLTRELDVVRKDFELEKVKELTYLKEKIASLEGKDSFITMLTEAHVAMKEKLTSLEAIVSTKSSHVIGKTGEATVLELLESGVIARFEHSELKDMTSVGHAADFHVWVVNAEGKRVKILVDSKKYKRAVSSEEIAKLAEDVDADVEASAGILISLDSGICTKKQFQISRTPKQKPILYLIVQDTTVDQQRDMISWSVRILMSVVCEENQEIRTAMLQNIDQFVTSIGSSVKEIDNVIRNHVKLLDTLRDTRKSLIARITAYKNGENMEEETVEENGCVAILKTGERCCDPVSSGDRCGKHSKRTK